MYSVRRLEPETVLRSAEVTGGTAGIKSPRQVTFAVVDEAGEVVFTQNALTKKPQAEVYPSKAAAEQAAAYYNRPHEAQTIFYVEDDPGLPLGRTNDPFAGLDEATIAELRGALLGEWVPYSQLRPVEPYAPPPARPATSSDSAFFNVFWRRVGPRLVSEIRSRLQREHAKGASGMFTAEIAGTVVPPDWKPFLEAGASLQPVNALLRAKVLTLSVPGFPVQARVSLSGSPQRGKAEEPFEWDGDNLTYRFRWELDQDQWDEIIPVQEGKAVGTARHYGQIAIRDLTIRHQGAFPSTHRSRIRAASANATREIGPIQTETRNRLRSLLGRWTGAHGLARGQERPDFEAVRLASAKILREAYEKMREVGRGASALHRHGPGIDSRVLRDEETWFRSAVREELRYWNVFLDEIQRGQVVEGRMWKRIDAYVDALRFVYESARVLAFPDNVLLYWQGPGPLSSHPQEAGHICEGCDYLMERSPFTKTTLPAVPLDGSTACLTNCRHKLVARVVTNLHEVVQRAAALPRRETMIRELRRLKEEKHGTWRQERGRTLASRHRAHPTRKKAANPFHREPAPPPREPFSL